MKLNVLRVIAVCVSMCVPSFCFSMKRKYEEDNDRKKQRQLQLYQFIQPPIVCTNQYRLIKYGLGLDILEDVQKYIAQSMIAGFLNSNFYEKSVEKKNASLCEQYFYEPKEIPIGNRRTVRDGVIDARWLYDSYFYESSKSMKAIKIIVDRPLHCMYAVGIYDDAGRRISEINVHCWHAGNAFSADRKYVATITKRIQQDNHLQVWYVNTGLLVYDLQCAKVIKGIAFGNGNNTIKITFIDGDQEIIFFEKLAIVEHIRNNILPQHAALIKRLCARTAEGKVLFIENKSDDYEIISSMGMSVKTFLKRYCKIDFC